MSDGHDWGETLDDLDERLTQLELNKEHPPPHTVTDDINGRIKRIESEIYKLKQPTPVRYDISDGGKSKGKGESNTRSSTPYTPPM